MNNEFTCPICGEPTRKYMGNYRKDKLCGLHADALKAGLIEQCPNCQSWHETETPCDCKKANDGDSCIICKNKTKGGFFFKKKGQLVFCKDCFQSKNKYYNDLDHLKTKESADEYYYNLKNNIFRLKNFQYAQDACLKLYAIAQIIDEFQYCGQQDKAVKDITYLLTKKEEYLNNKSKTKTVEEPITNTEIEDYRKVNPTTVRCKDGHYVRSSNEKIIDDALYEEKIFHEYEKKYKALDGKNYYPDFYIPEINLFIEYFGVAKNEQKNLYKKELFEKDTYYNFAFIWPESNGILDERVLEIIEDYRRKLKK